MQAARPKEADLYVQMVAICPPNTPPGTVRHSEAPLHCGVLVFSLGQKAALFYDPAHAVSPAPVSLEFLQSLIRFYPCSMQPPKECPAILRPYFKASPNLTLFWAAGAYVCVGGHGHACAIPSNVQGRSTFCRTWMEWSPMSAGPWLSGSSAPLSPFAEGGISPKRQASEHGIAKIFHGGTHT